MPYITQDERIKLEPILNEFDGLAISAHVPSEGEMNYLITSLMHRWLSLVGIRYHNLNSAVGIMECAKAELYRRVAAPYEDQKAKDNGCVSEVDYKPERNQV